MSIIKLSDIKIQVEKKNIKNLHLSVFPPDGRVHISAPENMELSRVRLYAISKLTWIKEQIALMKAQERETPRQFLSGESHYFLGERYLLQIVEKEAVPDVKINHKTIILNVRSNASLKKRTEIYEKWARKELRSLSEKLIRKWEKIIGVECKEFGIKKMKTKWGTCNTSAQRIWLNLELARKPVSCIEYIIVHELMHLVERSHSSKFISLMDKYLPKWEFQRDELNRLPYRHIDWNT